MVTVYGVDKKVDADVAINHVDLSETPAEYLEYLDRFPVVVNQRVTDIRKCNYSRALVGPDTDYDGPVILKTNRNYGGRPEARLKNRRLDRQIIRALVGKRTQSLGKTESLKPKDYPIYPSVREVPAEVFENDALIVERFQPEMEGDLYACRVYTFMGDRHTNARLVSRYPVVKGSSSLERVEVPVHEGIIAERERLGFDFGKFDYAVRDGDVVLFDANRTPGAPPFLGETPDYVRNVSRGLYSFLE